MVGLVIGRIVARVRREYECSEPSCATPMGHDATICPGCGGTVVGELKNRDERLEALERMRERNEEDLSGSA